MGKLTPQRSAQYHLVIINIFQAIVKPASADLSGAPSEPSFLGITARDVLLQTKLHLETIIRLYHLRHSFEHLDLFMIAPIHALFLLTAEEVANGDDTNQDARRSTLLICAIAAHRQGQSHFLGQTVLQILCGMMRPEDLVLLERIAKIPHETAQAVVDHARDIHSLWPASTTSIASDPDEHRLELVLRQYVGLTLEDSDSDISSADSP